MQIQMNEQGQNTEIKLTGRMTFSEKELFNEIVDHIGKNADKNICLDMGQLKFMDSAGLGMLLSLKDIKNTHGTSITLRGANGQVSSLLRIAKMGEFFSIEAH